MKTIEVAEFKKRCLTLLDNQDPEGLVITKDGKPASAVLPYGRASAELIGSLRGRLTIRGDLMTTGRLTRDRRIGRSKRAP